MHNHKLKFANAKGFNTSHNKRMQTDLATRYASVQAADARRYEFI